MEEILKKIESKAYWRVNIRPIEFKKNRIATLSEAKELIAKCVVKLSGWIYPYFQEGEIVNKEDYIQASLDWIKHLEYWRFYQSAQFIHYFSLWEDYHPDIRSRVTGPISNESVGFVGILSTLDRLTEIYEFVMRLIQNNLFDSGVYISIGLNNIKNYQLFFWDQGRLLYKPYRASINKIEMGDSINPEELLSKGHEMAIDDALYLLERFQWNPPRGLLAEQQKKFLERRL